MDPFRQMPTLFAGACIMPEDYDYAIAEARNYISRQGLTRDQVRLVKRENLVLVEWIASEEDYKNAYEYARE